MKVCNYIPSICKSLLLSIVMVVCIAFNTHAIVRVSVHSGSFNDASTWNPAGVPLASDDVVIKPGHQITISGPNTVSSLTIESGASLKYAASVLLIVNNNITISGTLDVTNGDLKAATAGSLFSINDGGTVIWNPNDNKVAGATLFTNCTEQFSENSTLIIKKWYNFQSVPLKNVISGNFGNLTLTTLDNGLLFEWDQKNTFESHLVKGKLTIDQGWVILDKSGSISNTTIGSIELKNINSYLDFHNGDHPGTFKVTTNSLVNIGGTLNGITDGEGNINLHVKGDLINVGYIVLLYNPGTIGKGNGNAVLTVDGKFRQPGGDFRGIFNLSSTKAGTVNLTFNDVEITGGQFFGHYACHTNNKLNSIKVKGNLKVTLSNNLSRFRGSGLTSLGGVNANPTQSLQIDGQLTINGNPDGEWTSSASTGNESVTVSGTTSFNGATVNFNYGNHNLVSSFEGTVNLTAGQVNMSRTTGSLTSVFNDSLCISGGEFSVKNDKGSATIVVNGPFIQGAGSVKLFNTASVINTDKIYFITTGNYTFTGGDFIFNNSSANNQQNQLLIQGEEFLIGDSAVYSGGASANVSGKISFDYPGTMQYREKGKTWTINNVVQSVSTGTTLYLEQGDLQIATGSDALKYYLIIENGGVLDVADHQIWTKGTGKYSRINVSKGGSIHLSKAEGLYNGTPSAVITPDNNLTFDLQDSSIVRYYGPSNITVTGINTGNSTGTLQQYSVLQIATEANALLTDNQVTVRTSLSLISGRLALTGHTLTIKNGDNESINAENGGVYDESNGKLVIENIKKGNHSWKYCNAKGELFEFSFNATKTGGSLTVSTKGTATNNFPYPANPAGSPISNLTINGVQAAGIMIDRYYTITGSNLSGDITLGYGANENTLPENLQNVNIGITKWENAHWSTPSGDKTGQTRSGKTIASFSGTGVYALIANPKNKAAEIKEFSVYKKDKSVLTEWTTLSATSARYFTVERSTDGVNFTSLNTQQHLVAGNEARYTFTDQHPHTGQSWYRLKQIDVNGITSYSEKVLVEFAKQAESINLLGVAPNPFKEGIEVTCEFTEQTDVELLLLNTSGQLIGKQSYQVMKGRNILTWNGGSGIPNGIYILTVTDGKTRKSTKIYKQ